MPQFVLLLRSEEIDFQSYSPDDYQKLLSEFESWNQELEKKGLYASAGLSAKGARTSRQTNGRSVIDGPFCETKEAVTGICVIEAADQTEAIDLASGCPFIRRGGSVEIRGVNQLEISRLFTEDSHAEVC